MKERLIIANMHLLHANLVVIVIIDILHHESKGIRRIEYPSRHKNKEIWGDLILEPTRIANTNIM